MRELFINPGCHPANSRGLARAYTSYRLTQPPMGYATIFYLHLAWHRGDRWAGTHRGLWFTGFEEGK